MIEELTRAQYIRTTKELIFEDQTGRTTNLIDNLPGFILDETNIDNVCDNEKEREKCYRLLENAKELG